MATNIDINAYLNISYATYTANFMTIIGSVFSIIIFSRKVFSRNSIGVYCRSLAIFDLFNTYNLGVGIATKITNQTLFQENNVLCKLYNYISPVFASMCAWRFEFFKKRWFQYSLIIGLLIFHCLLYTPNLFFSGIVVYQYDNFTSSQCLNPSFVMPIILLVESSLLTLIILFIVSALIIRFLADSRNKVANESSNTTSNTTNNSARQRRAKDLKFAFNSVILNIFHIFLTTPAVILSAIPISDVVVYLLANLIAYFFYSLNFALHFWVHLVVNSFFRKEFLIFIRVKKE